MKQKIIGVYPCGYDQIQLVLREGLGGEFFSCPEKGSIPRIKVGAQSSAGQWGAVLAILTHEVFEFAMFRADRRFNPDNRVHPLNHADYLFVMDHQQFADVASKVAEFFVDAIPDLAKAYAAWHKKRKCK